MNGIGQRIRLARGLAGLSQNQLAEKCGTAIQTVSKWELDRVDLPISTLKKISDALNVSIPFLLDIENQIGTETQVLAEDGATYGMQTEIRVSLMEREIKYLVECKESLYKQVEVQRKLIDAYESGFVPKNVANPKAKKPLTEKIKS
jgi:transcriptional regulator with XRE-family HTH domain